MIATLACRPAVDEHVVSRLRAGDAIEIEGELVTLRDASARRLGEILERGDPPPVDLRGCLLYASGPSPARPGQVVGSAGPTTTARLARYLPALFTAGARGIIGKGEVHGDLARTFADHKAVYLAAIGGLGALLAERIVAAEIVAFPDLGPEAIHRFAVRRFPVVVVIDQAGGNLHETARQAWRRDRRDE